MELTNNSRFNINKNALEYLKRFTEYTKKDIASMSNLKFVYYWDEDFKKYFKIDTKKLVSITNVYPDIDLLMQNIYFEELFKNIKSSAIEFAENLAKIKDNSLIIINISPLEWAIISKIFVELGIKNVVFNFNRSIFLNSTSKILEWIFYLYLYENSPFFKEQTKIIVDEINALKLNIQPEKLYVLFDENNTKEKYKHLEIDDYLKSQIWLQEAKNIYRVDKYPDKEFLLKKWISKIIFFDNDDDFWKINSYMSESLENIKVENKKYSLKQSEKIWYYEDYLISSNLSYLTYKKNIEKNALKTYSVYSKTSKNTNKAWYDATNYIKLADKNKKSKEKDYAIVPYLVLFPILVITFLASDMKWWALWRWNNTWTSTSSFFYNWWWINLWWGSSSSIWSSSTKSSSIIKSFWWWGFSKWLW